MKNLKCRCKLIIIILDMLVLVPVNLKKIQTIQLLNWRDKYCVVSLALKQGLNDENASHKQHV